MTKTSMLLHAFFFLLYAASAIVVATTPIQIALFLIAMLWVLFHFLRCVEITDYQEREEQLFGVCNESIEALEEARRQMEEDRKKLE